MVDATQKLKDLVEKRKASLVEKTISKKDKLNLTEKEKKEKIIDESIEILKKSISVDSSKIEKRKKDVKLKEETNDINFDDIETFLSKESKFSSILDKNIENISNNTLVHCDAKNNKDVMLAVIKKSLKENKTPILVLTSNNYRSFSKFLVKSKISLSNIFLIDTVSKSLINVNDFDKVILVDSLRNITQLQIKLLKLLRKNKNSVVIFDTLDVLELYHPIKILLKFTYSLIKLIAKNSSHSIVIVNSNSLAPKLSQFFNDFIEIKLID